MLLLYSLWYLQPQKNIHNCARWETIFMVVGGYTMGDPQKIQGPTKDVRTIFPGPWHFSWTLILFPLCFLWLENYPWSGKLCWNTQTGIEPIDNSLNATHSTVTSLMASAIETDPNFHPAFLSHVRMRPKMRASSSLAVEEDLPTLKFSMWNDISTIQLIVTMKNPPPPSFFVAFSPAWVAK